MVLLFVGFFEEEIGNIPWCMQEPFSIEQVAADDRRNFFYASVLWVRKNNRTVVFVIGSIAIEIIEGKKWSHANRNYGLFTSVKVNMQRKQQWIIAPIPVRTLQYGHVVGVDGMQKIWAGMLFSKMPGRG
ncbi:MAG TPA: hypothetical protein VFU15_12320 [Bacteroidia bacterium]|nr:hypothetical protein [Bacteroidia bacterium]